MTVSMPEPTSPNDPFGGLDGEDRDAYLAITQMLRNYGLESLAPTVLGYIQSGYSAETINVLLQNSDAYKRRFAANEARRQKGLPVLSPAEYLATERAYRQVMSAAGLPPGYWDEPDDFAELISNDVSPAEVQERVQIAADQWHSLDENAKNTWRQWYGDGDYIAYALDPERATTVLSRQWRAAQAAGIGQAQGVNLSQATAEQVAATGVSADGIRQGMGTVAAVAANTQRLSQVYGETYTAEDAAREVFLSDEKAAKKRRSLASRERATFGGSAGVGPQSLSARSGGQV